MNRYSLTIAVAASLLAAPGLSAQQPGLPDPGPSAVDRLAGVVNPGPLDEKAVRGIVADELKARDARQKQADEDKKKASAEKGHEVGSDLTFKAYWDNGLWFATPDNDWKFHFGGRFQFQSVWWAQDPTLRGPPPGNGGVPQQGATGGVGPLDDGTFFRRVRLRSDGVAYETFEYVLEVNLEQLNVVTFDHMWFGARDDYWGTLRVGQMKVPQGMEMIGSDYHLTFIERSPLADSLFTLFGQGVFYMNNFLDQNVVFQTMFHRVQPTQFYTDDFGNGNYASSTRITGTPVYEGDGAAVVHVGGSYQYRSGDLGRSITPGGTGSAFGDTQNVARFRARPNLRDGTGVGSTNFLGANTNRFVDTGYLLADGVSTLAPEFLLISGPFSVQAEAGFSYVNNARTLYGGNGLAPGQNVGTPMFWGGYVEASYILTGEHRGYDRRNGMYDRIKVRENAFFVKGEDGRNHWGTGAWQVGYRYSYLDLNANGITGGQLAQHDVAVNWYLNDNTKMQFVYLNADRIVPAPNNGGRVNGFTVFAQYYF